jgi:phage tail-like protein
LRLEGRLASTFCRASFKFGAVEVRNMTFRIKWRGRYVASVSHIVGLGRLASVINRREGVEERVSQGIPSNRGPGSIILQRVVIFDVEFWTRFNSFRTAGDGRPASTQDIRTDLIIEAVDEHGAVSRTYKVNRCSPRNYEALQMLDAKGSAVAIETLALQHEGWESDSGTSDPGNA